MSEDGVQLQFDEPVPWIARAGRFSELIMAYSLHGAVYEAVHRLGAIDTITQASGDVPPQELMLK